jgi:hypothetical protein
VASLDRIAEAFQPREAITSHLSNFGAAFGSPPLFWKRTGPSRQGVGKPLGPRWGRTDKARPASSSVCCPAEFGRVMIDSVTLSGTMKTQEPHHLFLGSTRHVRGTSRSPQPEGRNFFSPTHFNKQRAPISYVGRSFS